jgi:hypothetical protein
VASCRLNFLQLSNDLGIATTDQAVDVLAPLAGRDLMKLPQEWKANINYDITKCSCWSYPHTGRLWAFLHSYIREATYGTVDRHTKASRSRF